MSGPGAGGRPPGLPKTGGRTKGTPNKSTLALREKLASLNCDPAQELVRIATDPATERALKSNIFSLLLRYTHGVPKPENNPYEDPLTADSTLTINDAIQLAKYVIEASG